MPFGFVRATATRHTPEIDIAFRMGSKRPPLQLEWAIVRIMVMIEKKCSVYVVEDDRSVLDSLTLLLESVGYQSRGFTFAEELLESGAIQNACCLILDIELPGMSGFQLQEVLVASHTAVPVIFITGHDLPAMEGQALRLGAIAYLRKPFDDRALLTALQPCRK